MRTFPLPPVSIPISPAAACPLRWLSIPTKQSLLVPTISELKVTTGIFFSAIRLFNLSLTSSHSIGIIANAWIPFPTRRSMASSCSSLSTDSLSSIKSSMPRSSHSFFAVWIPRLISNIKEDFASWVTMPIFHFLFSPLFLALCL